MSPEALPTPREQLPDDRHPRRASNIDDERLLLEPLLGPEVDAFAVEWQLVTSGTAGQ